MVNMIRIYQSVATLIGAIVGVGIFGIPYVVSKSGFLIGVVFLFILTLAVLLLHLYYAEIILRTPGRHRFVGYSYKYLGRFGKIIAGIISIVIFYGALLSYIIVGGSFLKIIFDGNEFMWSIVFFFVCSLLVLFGLEFIAPLEILMSLFLVLVVILVLIIGFPYINYSNLKTIDFSNFFLPYGVIFFSLLGQVAVPEIKEILKDKSHKIKQVIILGTVIPAIIYFLFAFIVVGITGKNTSEEAMEGLSYFFHSSYIVLVAIFGVLAVASSFLILGINLKKIFWYDYNINKHIAWLLTISVPFLAYVLNLRDFIKVIGSIGACFCAIQAIILIVIYHKAKRLSKRTPEFSLNLPVFLSWSLVIFFILGIFYQVRYIF